MFDRQRPEQQQQSERQRTARFPLFPGNIEALSLPPISPEPLLESTRTTHATTATPISPSPPTQPAGSSPHPEKPKRKQTLAACRPCRKRKSRCDGDRPRCKTCEDKATPCVYSVEEGKTQQQASREELKAYRTVVNMLRKASAAETAVILDRLKGHEDVNDAVRFIEEDMMLVDGGETMSGGMSEY